MSHALPVSGINPDPDQPLGELIAETFFVAADGRLVREVQRAPRRERSANPANQDLLSSPSWSAQPPFGAR
jgi:hypothetical protein